MGWPERKNEMSLNPLHILAKVLWSMMIAVVPKPRGEDGALALARDETDR